MNTDFLDIPHEGNVWIFIWMILLLFGHILWAYYVSLLRKKAKAPKIHKQIVAVSYLLSISVEFYIFIQMLPNFPYRKSKFLESVLIPTISFYLLCTILIVGMIRFFYEDISKITGARHFRNHRVLLPLLEMCFSFAFSVRFPQILTVGSALITLITLGI